MDKDKYFSPAGIKGATNRKLRTAHLDKLAADAAKGKKKSGKRCQKAAERTVA